MAGRESVWGARLLSVAPTSVDRGRTVGGICGKTFTANSNCERINVGQTWRRFFLLCVISWTMMIGTVALLFAVHTPTASASSSHHGSNSKSRRASSLAALRWYNVTPRAVQAL